MLRLAPPVVDGSAEAWARVVRGFDEALEVDGLDSELRAKFIRCRGHAAREAGVRALAAAPISRPRKAGA